MCHLRRSVVNAYVGKPRFAARLALALLKLYGKLSITCRLSLPTNDFSQDAFVTKSVPAHDVICTMTAWGLFAQLLAYKTLLLFRNVCFAKMDRTHMSRVIVQHELDYQVLRHWQVASNGADGRDRTDNLRFTIPLLYHWATSAFVFSFFSQRLRNTPNLSIRK